MNAGSIPKNMQTVDEVLAFVEKRIDKAGDCVVFLDGLDEFNGMDGEIDAFNKIIAFIERKSIYDSSAPHHKFVISTRPEHFELHRMIRRKQGDNNLDNYRIYEFLPLELGDSYKICKSIKYLSKYDWKEGYTHFSDKWPLTVDESHPLSEREYLALLRKYLHTTYNGPRDPDHS